ncbi:MAG: RNA-guided endonuclease InsQ/TnpB family protein [Xenococcaceae cyanobacterium]
MRVAYQFKLLPTTEQKATFNKWLNMLRYQYNWLLGERFSWWEQNRTPVNACPLVCHLPSLKDKPDYYSQKKSLVTLKKERIWYKEVHSQVLQEMVKRVHNSFERFIKGDSNGKRSGKPRFKGQNRYRTFTYAQGQDSWVRGNKVNLPKIGEVKVIFHRELPQGFTIKTVSVTKKADGFYITFSLEDKTIPDFTSKVEPTENNSIGIDLGLEKFLVTSSGEIIEPPKFYRQSQAELAKLSQKVSAKKKGSRAKNRLSKRRAKLHLKIARQREQFHHETAKELLAQADVIFSEDLKISNMARRNKPKMDEKGNYLLNKQAQKSGRNKSFYDAGLAQFIDILADKAEKAGLKVIKVNPKGTSQCCSSCLNVVPKELSDRWHDCPHCGCSLDRDHNSAILIKLRGLGHRFSIKCSSRKSKKLSAREAHA